MELDRTRGSYKLRFRTENCGPHFKKKILKKKSDNSRRYDITFLFICEMFAVHSEVCSWQKTAKCSQRQLDGMTKNKKILKIKAITALSHSVFGE